MFREFKDNNICAIPLTDKNTPKVFALTPYWDRLPSESEIKEWVSVSNYHGIGLVCNDSTQVRCLDLDDKNDESKRLSSDFLSILKVTLPEIYSKLYLETTKSNGTHIIFRADMNDQLNEFVRSMPKIKSAEGRSLIDIFTNKHYVATYPTPNYQQLQGDILQLNIISSDEFKSLLELAQKFNQFDFQEKEFKKQEIAIKQKTGRYYNDKNNPKILYNQSDDYIRVLQANGWKFYRKSNVGLHFTRPGKETGTSGIFYNKDRRFHVFTSNTSLRQGRSLEPFHLFIVYEAKNNDKLGHDMLVKMGYGGREKKLFEKSGYLEFKDFFLKECRETIIGLKYRNKELYRFYQQFNSHLPQEQLYDQSTVVRLIRHDAEWYGLKAVKSRNNKECFTTFKKKKVKMI